MVGSAGCSPRTIAPARACCPVGSAVEVHSDLNFWHFVVDELTQGSQIDYLVCDEAQFYRRDQIDQLARIVDELSIDVYAFGILTDFRTKLFAGSQRLVELADRINRLQVEALCWCGARGTHNARTEDGAMVTEGDVIVVGDLDEPDFGSGPAAPPAIGYEVLCRRHHRRRMTAAAARAAKHSPDVLPFD
jgi:thymidine kinase